MTDKKIKYAKRKLLCGYDIAYDEKMDYAYLTKCSSEVKILNHTEEIDEIGQWACADNTNLEEIHISSSVKKIGQCAFFNCKNLKKICLEDARGEIKEFTRAEEFCREFQGIIGDNAFENCFGNNILVKMDNMSEETMHSEFEEALSPYPFFTENEEVVFAKILSSSDEGEIHISLINLRMLLYDLQYFAGENNENTYYRPYFYEFYISDEENKYSKVIDEHLKEDGWRIAKITEDADSKIGEYAFDGTVFFSASPFRYKKKTLVIQDKMAPKEVCDRIKKVYELTKTQSITIKNRNACLTPLLKKVLNHAYASRIKVYNVGQAACNYIYLSNGKKIMFDIGYSNKEKDLSDLYIKKNQFIFQHCKPDLIILSHWDLDHILGVAYAKNNVYNVPWIVPSMQNLPKGQYTVSAARLAKYLAWKKKLYLIDDQFNGKDVFQTDAFQIWKGIGKDRTSNCCGKTVIVNGVEIKGLNKANNSGLIICLKTNHHTMLLPGDCEYQMLPMAIYSHNARYSNIIVPHHGSKMPLIRCKRKSIVQGTKDNAIISAGDNIYNPKHPWEVHENFLKRLKYNVWKTSTDCKNRYVITVDLEKNTIT